jgi:hypothetical protein
MCITRYETRVIHRAGGAASTMAWRMQHPAGRHRPSDARLRAGTASRRCRFATGRRYAGQTSVAQVPSRPANPPLRTTRDAHWVGRLPRRRGFLRQRTGHSRQGAADRPGMTPFLVLCITCYELRVKASGWRRRCTVCLPSSPSPDRLEQPLVNGPYGIRHRGWSGAVAGFVPTIQRGMGWPAGSLRCLRLRPGDH